MDLGFVKEKWVDFMNRDPEKNIESWNSVAQEYTEDPHINFNEDGFLRFLDTKLEWNRDMRVLDVGCGAGAYTLEIAQRTGWITGTDFSPVMLQKGREAADRRNIRNCEFVEADWMRADGTVFGTDYDLVYAHTTPAVGDYDSMAKLMHASRRYCCVCRPARRKDVVFDRMKELVGLSDAVNEKNDDTISYMFDMVWGMGYNPDIHYLHSARPSRKKLEDAVRFYVGRIQAMSPVSEAEEHKMKEMLEKMSTDGFITETTEATQVILFWEK